MAICEICQCFHPPKSPPYSSEIMMLQSEEYCNECSTYEVDI